ncbi:heme NO-binding domain-containing protein [Celerinatantimonas yamalensis]|uniref:Heme NO-binding domain-containing protein n=1 Tax=Celerinatantimonas yamalensis TaxID=559956 RepID=A0ABW9G6W8_9GAMM
MVTMMQPLASMLNQSLRQYRGQVNILEWDAQQLMGHYTDPIQVLDELAHHLKLDSCTLQRLFGKSLFYFIVENGDRLLDSVHSSFELFRHPGTVLHLEIAELYHDHTPPRFTILQWQPNKMILEYQSSLPFAHVCHGFLTASSEYFAESIVIHQQLINGALNHAHFTLTKIKE